MSYESHPHFMVQTVSAVSVIVIIILIASMYSERDSMKKIKKEKRMCEIEHHECKIANAALYKRTLHLNAEINMHTLRWIMFPEYIKTVAEFDNIMSQLRSMAPSTQLLLVDITPYAEIAYAEGETAAALVLTAGGMADSVSDETKELVTDSAKNPTIWQNDRYIIEFEYGVLTTGDNTYAIATETQVMGMTQMIDGTALVMKVIRSFYY